MYESYKMSGRTSDRLRLAKQSRQEAVVNIAFFSVAPASRQYRRMLSSGYSELSAIVRQILATAEAHGELVAAIDVAGESAALIHATQGLLGPVLIGVMPPEQTLTAKSDEHSQSFATKESCTWPDHRAAHTETWGRFSSRAIRPRCQASSMRSTFR